MSLTVIVLGLQAQEQHCWEQYLNQVMNAEDMASEQWQENYDLLCELEQHPININKTTREELEQMPFLSTQQVEALMEYLQALGVLVKKVSPKAKSSYQRSQEDKQAGRVEKFSSSEEMFKSLGI